MLSNILKHSKTISNNYSIKRPKYDRYVIFFWEWLHFGQFFTEDLNTNISLVPRSFMHHRKLWGTGLPVWFSMPDCLLMPFLSCDWETTYNNCYFFLIKMIGIKSTNILLINSLVISSHKNESKLCMYLKTILHFYSCIFCTPPHFFPWE